MSRKRRRDRKYIAELERRLFGEHTYDVNGQWNEAVDTEKENLIRLIMDVIEITGQPEEWEQEYMLYTLLTEGVCAITDSDIGVVPVRCGYSGVNVWDKPTEIVIANHVIGDFRRTIGVDGALIRLQYNFKNIMPLVEKYAYLLGNCDASIAVNLMNTRVAFIADCESAAQEAAMRKMYEEITYGQPAVYFRNGGKADFFYLNPKQSYIASDIHLLKRQIKNEFLSQFGVYSANQEKKERMIVSEVENSGDNVMYNIGSFINSINSGFKVANRLFGLNLHCRRKEYSEGGGSGGNDAESSAMESENMG